MQIFELLISLLSILSEGIDGRTTVQKLGYFISVKLAKSAGYAADFYGPFSSSVAIYLQNLVETDFVVEKPRHTVRGRIMFTYSLTEDGVALAKKFAQKYPEEYATIRNIVKKCAKIVHCNYHVLSWAAKVHFVLEKSGKEMTYEEAMKASRLFGWTLDEKEIESGVNLLLALNLIKRS